MAKGVVIVDMIFSAIIHQERQKAVSKAPRSLGVVGCFGALAGLVFAANGADFFHAGPLFDEFDLTLSLGHRIEAAGPFYYSEQQGDQLTWAIQPLFAHVEDPSTESEEMDVLYPLLGLDRFGDQYRWHVFQLLSYASGPTQTETERSRFTLFPIYFHQHSSDPSEDYTAVLPFYGHLNNRLFRDEISFVMFPFYIQSRKADVVTDNYVYPFYHRRHGDGLSGWQLWPFFGEEHKDITTKTNGFGDIQTIGGHDEFFLLWPFYYQQKEGIGTDNPQWMQGSIPAFAKLRSPLRDSTTVLWPFFSRVDDREKKYREWELPWPFVVIARGEGKTITRVLPFFSVGHSAYLQSRSYLWPIYRYNRIHADPADRTRMQICFFLYSDVVEKNTETGIGRRRVDCWPFYIYRRDFNGNKRLQVLALIESTVSNSKTMERDYSPLWSIWRSEHNAKTGASSQSLFWNLYRHESTPAAKQSSLLFGLFQTRSDAQGMHVRLCYLALKK